MLAEAPMGLLPVTAIAAGPTIEDLKRMSLDELLDVEVYTASRRLEPSLSVPSAVFVLTSDDLRHLHVTSIPEALRFVPGVQVGRVDANKWAVSMRGFNSREANKLLVLLDGRSIYDPLFSGVLWESQDVMLEDVDRIEVIRGPGGTVWGANAFNGVINIISKQAAETQGGLSSVSVGDQETYTAALRYGWRPRGDAAARVYVKAYEHETGHSRAAAPGDAATMFRSGFRWDWAASERDGLRISGDVFDATTGTREDPTLVQDVVHQGHNLTTQWTRELSPTNSLQARLTYDFVSLNGRFFDQDRRTYDLELQQTVQPSAMHAIVLGGGYRRMFDETRSGLAAFVDVLPRGRDDALFNVFAQDTITLLQDRVNLVLGLKYEKTDYAASEWLPNVRVAWTPSGVQTIWAAVSEATRVPSRLEADLTFFGSLRIGDNLRAEQVRAYELGQRWLVSEEFWCDVAVFYNDYDELRSSEAGGLLGNGMRGHTSGTELATRWQPSNRWRFDLAYTYLRSHLRIERSSTASPQLAAFIEGLSPEQQVSVRAAFNASATVELDAAVRYVDPLPALQIEQYTVLDLAATWRPIPSLELSLVGQNLLQDHHLEQDFALSASGLPTEVERQFYARAAWGF
jgi:iron complex outermembrane receptor protein